jgi:hypothetical protein
VTSAPGRRRTAIFTELCKPLRRWLTQHDPGRVFAELKTIRAALDRASTKLERDTKD